MYTACHEVDSVVYYIRNRNLSTNLSRKGYQSTFIMIVIKISFFTHEGNYIMQLNLIFLMYTACQKVDSWVYDIKNRNVFSNVKCQLTIFYYSSKWILLHMKEKNSNMSNVHNLPRNW